MARKRVRDHATQFECLGSESFTSCGSVLACAGQVALEWRLVFLQPHLGSFEEATGAVAVGEGGRRQGDVGSGTYHVLSCAQHRSNEFVTQADDRFFWNK